MRYSDTSHSPMTYTSTQLMPPLNDYRRASRHISYELCTAERYKAMYIPPGSAVFILHNTLYIRALRPYSFIFHKRAPICCWFSSSSAMPVGSAKEALNGVTLAQPFQIAHPSVPGGTFAFDGLIKGSMSGANLNTSLSSPLPSCPLPINSTGGAFKASGPAGETTGFEVACALNNLPYEFLQIFVQYISTPSSVKSFSIIGMFTLYRSTSPLRKPPSSTPQLS